LLRRFHYEKPLRKFSKNSLSTPSEISKKCLNPWKLKEQFLTPSEIFLNRWYPFRNVPFTTPLRNFNLAPPQKFRTSDPLGKSPQQGGVDIKWNGPQRFTVFLKLGDCISCVF
jgi:hypothetical protein